MTRLDLHDIQGNIDRPYGRYGFPYSRTFLFHIAEDGGAAGRWFVDQVRHYVTTAEPWGGDGPEPERLRPKPPVTLNIAFTWHGLRALDLPVPTLRGMPDEFIEGMARRCTILGDIGPSHPDRWDPVWRDANRPGGRRIHAWVSLCAQAAPDGRAVPELEVWTTWLHDLCAHPRAEGKVELLRGHGRDGTAAWQESATLMARDPHGNPVPTPFEHFGFTDGIADPAYEGQQALQADPGAAIGNGKLLPGPYDPARSWQPLATGEFLLGHASEGQELPPSAAPYAFLRNGTFMAVRKLHQNTGRFAAEIERHAAAFQRVAGLESLEEARETLRAKMVGRWSSGVPLAVAPTYAQMRQVLAGFPLLEKQHRGERMTQEEAREAKRQLRGLGRALAEFHYADDPEGRKCPLGAHVRRANPRDMLDPAPERDAAGGVARSGSTLVNRRRILRRGLPYGETTADDAGEHGVLMMALCASLFRQFEFVQQQWMQYGLDFEAGNDTCPMIGHREQPMKFVVAAGGDGTAMPYVAADLPQFVETRGGEYFFVPSLSALRMIAMGEIDPT